MASPSRAGGPSAAAPAAMSPRSLARLPTYAQVAYLLKLQEQKQAAAAAAAADDDDAASEIPPPPPHPVEEEHDVIHPLDSVASSRAHSRAASRSNLHQQLRQANEAPRTPRSSRDAVAARVQNSPSRSPGAPVASAANTPSPRLCDDSRPDQRGGPYRCGERYSTMPPRPLRSTRCRIERCTVSSAIWPYSLFLLFFR